MDHGVNIKLGKPNGLLIIIEPSGKKIRANDLQKGKYYLRSDDGVMKFNSYRYIIEIDEEKRIFWYDGIMRWTCRPQYFVSKFGYEATPEEVRFIDSRLEKWRYSENHPPTEEQKLEMMNKVIRKIKNREKMNEQNGI